MSLIQTTFTFGKRDLASYERDGVLLDTTAVREAAITCTRLEDGLIFNGASGVPDRYNLLFRRYPRGNFSEMEHVRTMVTEGAFKAPILEGGGVLLASGRQYASIVLGQDMAIGFIGPIGEKLEFSISESLALLIRQAQAICVLE